MDGLESCAPETRTKTLKPKATTAKHKIVLSQVSLLHATPPSSVIWAVYHLPLFGQNNQVNIEHCSKSDKIELRCTKTPWVDNKGQILSHQTRGKGLLRNFDVVPCTKHFLTIWVKMSRKLENRDIYAFDQVSSSLGHRQMWATLINLMASSTLVRTPPKIAKDCAPDEVLL